MALTSRQKKQGAAVTVAVGALTLGGVAVATLGTPDSAAGSNPVNAAAVPAPAGTLNAAPNSAASPSGSTTITITAQAEATQLTDDTAFLVSGEVKGAQPGTKIRLQRQSTPTSKNSSPSWSTLAYTTFTDKSNKFSLAVKMETAGSYNLRILHPQDREGPATAYSNPFAVTVSGTASPGAASKASATAKASAKASSAKSDISSKRG
jgi:hypothetical protein